MWLTPWALLAPDIQGVAFKAQNPVGFPGDIDRDGDVDVANLIALLAAWGPCPQKSECPEDLDGSGTVDFGDLLLLLAAWGACE